jgi:hypothetical protein
MTAGGLRRLDRRRLSVTPDEIVCVACARNESLRLPYFLAYYRRLGVHRFLVADNASDDGTTEALLAEPDVHVFHADERYSASGYGVSWTNALLASFAAGHWALTVDLDELFVYPGCEDIDLAHLARDLDRRGEEAVASFLLDMYGDRAIRETIYVPPTPFVEICPYFDGDSYEWGPAYEGTGPLPIRGGPRHRAFWSADAPQRPAPYLPKIPFVRWKAGLAYTASTHVLDSIRLSGLTSVLLHFKFFSDFVERTTEEVRRGEHWQNAGQYAMYARVLRAQPALRLMYAGSVRYEHSRQLVALSLMRAPRDRGGTGA